MAVRFCTSAKQWKRLAPFFPGKESDPGCTAHDNRLAVEAMLYMAREGCTWRALPPDFGEWMTVYQRFRRWQQQGVFERLFQQFSRRTGVHSLMVDGTIIHVHQDGTGARKARGDPESQGIGHSRGGRTTKLLAATDENGQLISYMILPGNAGESPYVPDLIEGIEASAFIGDKAYDTDNILKLEESREMEIVVPPKSNRKVQRPYDKEKYKTRHFVENLFQRLKRFRRIATRYDKTAASFVAFIILVAVYLATKTPKSVLRYVEVAKVPRESSEVYVSAGYSKLPKISTTQGPEDISCPDPPG